MSSPAARQVVGSPASQPVFPDEIMEEIFLRLDAVEDLARASAACTTFRRLVSARRFLHRFRCLHPPLILGVLDCSTASTVPPRRAFFHPAEPPHRSAPAARALAQSADFTLPCGWIVCDARDSRVLLYKRTSIFAAFADLMVCDPLHRRHVQLPPIPDDLAAATGSRGMQNFDPFLDPDTGEDKEKQDLSFQVICAVQCQHKLVTFHFSSVSGQWRGITFNRTVPLCSSLVKYHEKFEHHYAHGCHFWTIRFVNSFMIMLNMHDMGLSVVDLPPGILSLPRARAIVEAEEGMIGLFAFSFGMSQSLQLYSLQGTEWQHERIIPLPKLNSRWIINTHWSIDHAAAGYLLLKASPLDDASQFGAMQGSQYITLNLKTFLVEELCAPNNWYNGGVMYASFPSPFSLPSI